MRTSAILTRDYMGLKGGKVEIQQYVATASGNVLAVVIDRAGKFGTVTLDNLKAEHTGEFNTEATEQE